MQKVDILIGSKLGLWALHNFDPSQIRQVIADSPTLVEEAVSRGFTVGELRAGTSALALHWHPILTPDQIALYRHLWNVHPGLLPRARGMFPVFWSVYLNEPAGATVHQMSSRVDVGPIFLQQKVEFGTNESAGGVRERVSLVEQSLALQALEMLSTGNIPPVIRLDEQPGPNRTLAKFLRLRDDPPLKRMTREQIERLILALTDDDFPLPPWAEMFATPMNGG